MTPEMQTTVVAASLSAITGILGYLYREHQQKVRPFVGLLEFWGNVQKRSVDVPCPKHTVQRSEEALYIRHLQVEDTLRGCDKTLDEVKAVKEDGDEIIRNLQNCIAAIAEKKSDDSLAQALADVLRPRFFQSFIALATDKTKLVIPKAMGAINAKIELHPSKERGGSLWIPFPGAAVLFGAGYDEEPYLKVQAMPFLQMVTALDRDRLTPVLEGLLRLLKEELAIAKEIFPTVEQVVQEHCKWGIEVFFANLGTTPLMIMPKGKLFVKDETGAHFEEETYLVLLKPDKEDEDETVRLDTKSPLVIRGGTDAHFEFITVKTQAEMSRGKALRDAYQSKKARAQLQFALTRPGLRREDAVSTEWSAFND